MMSLLLRGFAAALVAVDADAAGRGRWLCRCWCRRWALSVDVLFTVVETVHDRSLVERARAHGRCTPAAGSVARTGTRTRAGSSDRGAGDTTTAVEGSLPGSISSRAMASRL